MTLVATPQLGEKEVSYSAISDWIADKLKQEFQVIFLKIFQFIYLEHVKGSLPYFNTCISLIY